MTENEWPAEPWILGARREAECLYQEGELVPLVLADPSRQMSEREALGTLDRIQACVNALAGIADPEGFVRAVKIMVYADLAADAEAQADYRLGEEHAPYAHLDVLHHLGHYELGTAEAAYLLRTLVDETPPVMLEEAPGANP